MRHVILLRNSYSLAKHAMALVTVMIRRLVVGSFVVAKDTSPCLIIRRDPYEPVAFRISGLSSRRNLPDLGCYPFTIIFDFNCGKGVTSIFMGQGKIFFLIILQLILHGLGESILNLN